VKIRESLQCAIWLVFFPLLLLSGCRQETKTKPDHPQVASGVDIRDVIFFSHSLGRQMAYRVFLPSNLSAGQRLPVVYLLHGAWTDYRDWSNSSNVSQYARSGVILVMPQGDFSYYMNAVEPPSDKYEDYITKDLIADVGNRFPAKQERGNRAIVGVSMGGFAAVDYALLHPDLYIFAGALSPSVDMPRRQFTIRRFDQWLRIRRIFGAWGSKERLARDPFELVRTVNPKSAAFIYLTVGQNEPLYEPNMRFNARLQQAGFAHEFRTEPGGHDWSQWNTELPGCFTSLFAHLSES
jgi:putative tributyrin esterase